MTPKPEKKPPGDNRSPQKMQADAEAGEYLGAVMSQHLHGVEQSVAYNALAVLAALVVFVPEIFEHPEHALEEFDNWTKFVRNNISSAIKAKLS